MCRAGKFFGSERIHSFLQILSACFLNGNFDVQKSRKCGYVITVQYDLLVQFQGTGIGYNDNLVVIVD